MSNVHTTLPSIKDHEMTNVKHSNVKTYGPIYVQKMNEKQICNKETNDNH